MNIGGASNFLRMRPGGFAKQLRAIADQARTIRIPAYDRPAYKTSSDCKKLLHE